jgi:hypothetical protein
MKTTEQSRKLLRELAEKENAMFRKLLRDLLDDVEELLRQPAHSLGRNKPLDLVGGSSCKISER